MLLSEQMQKTYETKGGDISDNDFFAWKVGVVVLESCDLCDNPAQYRQCQKCMNDKLVGSHTDEEWNNLKYALDIINHNLEKGLIIPAWKILQSAIRDELPLEPNREGGNSPRSER